MNRFPVAIADARRKRFACALSLFGALSAGLASAGTDEDPGAIRWNGFLNVVAGRLRYDTDTPDGISRPGYYGYEDTVTFDR